MRLWLSVGLAGIGLLVFACRGSEQEERKTVKAIAQMRPGGPVQEVEMEVHAVPVNPPSVSAGEASLHQDDLVLGIVLDGRAMAYPIRYLAMTEVVNDSVGEMPLSPTW